MDVTVPRLPPSSTLPRLLLLFLASTSFVHAQSLSEDQINSVKTRLQEGAKLSWELGTRAQALIDYDSPSYSVLNGTAIPPSTSNAPGSLNDVFAIAKSVVADRAHSNANATGPQPLIKDGSAADPASIGVAVLLANWTGQASGDGVDFAGAAQDQLNYLLNVVPRTGDGAISHRVSEVQLWSDFVYMVPPFLAYSGVLANNQTLVREAYNQIKLYRQYLSDSNAKGLWKHIVMGSSVPPDNGHWSTGMWLFFLRKPSFSRSILFTRKWVGSSWYAARPRDHPAFTLPEELQERDERPEQLGVRDPECDVS